MRRVSPEPCPCCFGAVVGGVCTACHVAIGTAKPCNKDLPRYRTIASPWAECVGRPMLARHPCDIITFDEDDDE